MSATSSGVKVITRNRAASHNFELMETYEAGLALIGSEIKSIRAGKINITDGFVEFRDNEAWLLNVHIATYTQAAYFGHEPLRARKLLLHKKEIAQLQFKVATKGYTIVPLQIYLKNGRAKIEIALARGRKNYDKRDNLRDKDLQREIQREWKSRE